MHKTIISRHTSPHNYHTSYVMYVLTRIEIDTAHKRNVHAEPPMRAGTLEATKRSNLVRPRRSSRRRHNQGHPGRFLFRTVRTHLILRPEHQLLETLFEGFLVGHSAFGGL